jgi:hypothetical protein
MSWRIFQGYCPHSHTSINRFAMLTYANLCCFVLFLQALEVGLTPGGVARHLINLALLRQGTSDDQLLPPPAKPETAASAQWAQATGSNDSVADITQQLANAAVERREELDIAAYKVGATGMETAIGLSTHEHAATCSTQHHQKQRPAKYRRLRAMDEVVLK